MKQIQIIRTPTLAAEVDLREAFLGLAIVINEPAVREALGADPNWANFVHDKSGVFVLRTDAVAALNAAEEFEAAEYWHHMPGTLLHFNWNCCTLLD